MIAVLLLITVVTLLRIYIKWHFRYWKRKGFPCIATKIPFGALDAVRRKERSLGMAIYDVYKSTKEPVIGIFMMFRPALLVRDAQLARDMLTKDFASFHDRGIYVDEESDPHSGNLFALKGNKWKTLRKTLTPSFSSGKLKAMFGTTGNIADKMLDHLYKIVPEQGSVEIEMKSVATTYAIDIIASVIFGLDVDSFKDPNNEFRTISNYINDPGFANLVRGTTQFLYPSLEKIFVKLGWKEIGVEKMKNLVKRTIAYREENNVIRKDLLQMLLQLRNTGKINADDDIWTAETTADTFKSVSVEMISAQLLLFFVAGYETSASSIAFTLYELRQNPEILAKVEQDIAQALQQHGKLTYEALQDMKYLDLCIMETVRKYPGLPILNRECTQDYAIPATDKIIEKGTPIIISLFGIHRDERYFPEPLRYDPERYLCEKENYNPVAYMPFGEGPRHCIAQRMGKINAKMALVKIISNFKLETRTERKEIEIANYGVPIMPKNGIPVRLSKRKIQDSI